jgi:hypothetical protein
MSTNKMISLNPVQVDTIRNALIDVLDSPAFSVDTKILVAEILKKLNGRQVKGVPTNGK